MDAATFVSGLSVVASVAVGIVLSRQIKSQKQIIERYKGLVEATSPDKIIELQKREVELIESIYSTNIKQLNEQVFELGNYVVHMMNVWNMSAKSLNQPELFNRDSFISHNVPHCADVLVKIEKLRIAEGIK